MLICIDAGHYMGTPGKRCLKSIDPGETREWFLNARIADKVQHLLKKYVCETMRVDDITGEDEVTLYERVKLANAAKADIYISIHHNAGINGGSGGGIVVFRCSGVDEETKKLQETIYRYTVATTGLRGNRYNPLGVEEYYVLTKTSMPAVLGEFGFMDSTVDTPLILTEDYANKVAAGIVAALVELYNLQEVEKPVTYDQWLAFMQQYETEQATKPVSDWAAEGVALAKEKGITDGKRPRSSATREEVAAMILAAIAGDC